MTQSDIRAGDRHTKDRTKQWRLNLLQFLWRAEKKERESKSDAVCEEAEAGAVGRVCAPPPKHVLLNFHHLGDRAGAQRRTGKTGDS